MRLERRNAEVMQRCQCGFARLRSLGVSREAL
jgi:hypothetical protein